MIYDRVQQQYSNTIVFPLQFLQITFPLHMKNGRMISNFIYVFKSYLEQWTVYFHCKCVPESTVIFFGDR